MISQEQIQNSQAKQDHQSFSNKASFSPHLTETLEITTDQPGNVKIVGNATGFYSQKHNMIIVCPTSGTVQFHDATTLLPHDSRETLKIEETVTKISYWSETDVYLLGCQEGAIFAYNASDQTLKRLQNAEDQVVFSVTFINSQYYAFSSFGSQQIQIGNLQQQHGFLEVDSRKSDPICLENLPKENVLFAGLLNGSVIMYGTSQIPKLPILYSIKPQQMERRFVIKIEGARINNREFLIAYGSDGKIRVWNLMKGRMKLVRMINIGQNIQSGVYLENYKMLAITCQNSVSIKFVSLVTGRLENTFDLEMQAEKIFMMKDKNTLGVADLSKDRIRMAKLG